MPTPTKTPSLLANAHAVASVSTSKDRPYASRTIAGLAQATALVACFVAAGMAAPAHAQSYRHADQYQVSANNTIHATVVGVSTYRERNRSSDFERRQDRARSQANRRTASLIGSIVNSAVGSAIGGGDSRYARNVANIGGNYAGQMASAMVGSRTRVNDEGWSGNVRVMSEQLSLVTLDVRYPGQRVERIQVRQPAAMSQGLRRGDDVTLELSVDPSTGRQMFVAVETPASRARSYRR